MLRQHVRVAVSLQVESGVADLAEEGHPRLICLVKLFVVSPGISVLGEVRRTGQTPDPAVVKSHQPELRNKPVCKIGGRTKDETKVRTKMEKTFILKRSTPKAKFRVF